jgi:hypothetical protein
MAKTALDHFVDALLEQESSIEEEHLPSLPGRPVCSTPSEVARKQTDETLSPPWLCPHYGNPAEIEGVGPSRDGTYHLTVWNCQACQVWAVTPSDLREPPTGWASKSVQ